MRQTYLHYYYIYCQGRLCYDYQSTKNSYVPIEKTYLEGCSMWSFVLHLVASFPGILFCILYFILSAQQCKFHLWPFYLFRQESAAFKGNLVLIFQRDLDAKLKHSLPTKHGIIRGLCQQLHQCKKCQGSDKTFKN